MNTSVSQEAKLQRQIEIEQEALAIGVSSYRESLLHGQTTGDVSGNKVYSKLISLSVEPVAQALSVILAEAKTGKAGRRSSYLKVFETLDPYEVSFLTVKSLITRLAAMNELTATAYVNALGRVIRDHMLFKTLNKEAGGLVRYIKKNKSAERANAANIRYNLKRTAAQLEVKTPEWTTQEAITVGEIMVQLVLENTGLIAKTWVKDGYGESKQILTITPEAAVWIQNMHREAELLSPIFLPMVVKPNEWTTPSDGGYLTLSRDTMIHSHNKNFISQLEDMKMDEVYKTINTLQNVPWKLNAEVYNVASYLWEIGGDVAGLPRREKPELPEKPIDFPYHLEKDDPAFIAWKAEHYEAWVEWKRAAKQTYIESIKDEGQRILVAQQLWMAERYVNEEEFYFPYFFDWRGRVYSTVSMLSPQANDLGKAMLQFAEGKPLGDSGVKWLKIHLANTFGVDKVSFEERIRWVEEHQIHILQCAADPISCQYWTDADSPFSFLAACFEYAGYTNQGKYYVSHLPIAMDGSNNGLQHFSTMLRDPIGGKATNVIPSDTPQDIYMEVVKAVNEELALRVLENKKMNQLTYEAHAEWWSGKINRSLVKRNVMTVPYSVTLRGMVGQLLQEYKKQGLEDGSGEAYERCKYLANIVYDAIGKTVVAARQAQDWLKEVAKLAAGEGLPLYWKTPAGFVVCQDYLVQTEKRVDTEFGSIRIRRRYKGNTNKRDKTKMAAGISANMVHSMDAAHLMKVVNRASDEVITSFALIHDSYGVHPSEVDTLHRLLREEFINLYQGDWLEEFERQLTEQLPADVVALFPERPRLGSLDIESVKDSRYFFA